MTHLSVSVVSAEMIEERVKDAHVPGHLLHASYLSLFISVCEFYHYAG